uniref:protein-serine/threonine phosphatase n=1 Tax=Setaria italica TaxID=4555 RepID=K3YTH0_SETIT
MVCIGSLLRALVLRAAASAGRRRGPRVLCGGRAADVRVTPRHGYGWRGFRAVAGRMMLDSSDPASPAAAADAGQVQPQRRAAGAVAQAHDGGYASGGWEREDGKLSCGYSSFRGKRATMEDFYDVKLTEIDGQAVSLFGVFDGHGGSRAAEYLKEHLFENLLKHPEFLTDTKLAISETYQKTDTDFLESEASAFRDDGSTASTAVLVGDHLYVANVGDSRAVISKAGKAMALSEDHKPNRIDERKRIENAGGIVIWAGTWRVGGVLAMSRAFGNRLLKPYVVAEPEIQEEQVNGELECLVLASDGLWDVVENEVITLLPSSAVQLSRQLFNFKWKHCVTAFRVCFGVAFLLLTKWSTVLRRHILVCFL